MISTAEIVLKTKNGKTNNCAHNLTEWLIVAGWRVFGGLGLLCGGKKFLGRADFEPFWPIWKKNLGKLLELEFFLQF